MPVVAWGRCVLACVSAHTLSAAAAVQIIWLALFSFINEILLGPQGILNLLQRKLDVL